MEQEKIKVEDLMSLKELCEYLPDKPAVNTVYGWVKNKKIPYVKIGKKLFFNKPLIDRWNDNRFKQIIP